MKKHTATVGETDSGMNKELLLELNKFLEECDKKIQVPDKERICLNCRFRGRAAEALCECTLFHDITGLDDSCDHFKVSLNYLQSKLREELMNE